MLSGEIGRSDSAVAIECPRGDVAFDVFDGTSEKLVQLLDRWGARSDRANAALAFGGVVGDVDKRDANDRLVSQRAEVEVISVFEKDHVNWGEVFHGISSNQELLRINGAGGGWRGGLESSIYGRFEFDKQPNSAHPDLAKGRDMLQVGAALSGFALYALCFWLPIWELAKASSAEEFFGYFVVIMMLMFGVMLTSAKKSSFSFFRFSSSFAAGVLVSIGYGNSTDWLMLAGGAVFAGIWFLGGEE